MRRYVGHVTSAGVVTGVNVVPGGPSGVPGDPGYATQLATWLTADYHSVQMSVGGTKPETLVPPPAP